MRPARWTLALAVGAAAVLAYIAAPTVSAQDAIYTGIGLAATICVGMAHRHRPASERRGWSLVALAMGCFVAGDAVLDVYDLILHTEAPFPSSADVCYLAGYPLLFLGIAEVARLRGASAWREALLDAGMVCVGALAGSWQLLIGTYAHDATLSGPGKIVTMAYPVMDLGLLFVLVTAMIAGTARRSADAILGAAIGVMLVADFVYEILILDADYATGDLVDVAYLITYLLLAAAALHPSTTRPSPVLAQRPTGRRWLMLVAAAAFVSPGLLLASSIAGLRVDVGVLAATSIVLFTLAVLRARLLFARLRRRSLELAQHGESLRTALAVQRRLEVELRFRVEHDSLTGLANRTLLLDRVEHALNTSPSQHANVAVLFCGLDRFKSINESRGHQLGDALLVAVGERLVSGAAAGATVARIGGDEFAVLLENVNDVVAIAQAERIVGEIRRPVIVAGQACPVSMSVGVAVGGAGTSAEALLSAAGAAMYEAKGKGKDRVAVFEPVMHERARDRTTLTSAFEDSLIRGDFLLVYQPQIRLSDGRLEGFEALVRWQHPSLGLVGPDRFIPLAEDTGFIVALGRWILSQACMDAAGWERPDGGTLSVAVNLSGLQLQSPALVDDVETALVTSGLSPQDLVLEITENVLVDDPDDSDDAATRLRQLRSMGIRIAIDDFGTGYSSLSYLRRLPVDILKIDKSFIDPLVDPASEATAFVETILRLAQDLHLSAIAEGIEHHTQLDTLRRLNCDSAQGYLMSRPLGIDATNRYIADPGRTLTVAEPV